MSKREKQFYCKLGQAVCNLMFTVAVIGAMVFYFVAALVM